MKVKNKQKTLHFGFLLTSEKNYFANDMLKTNNLHSQKCVLMKIEGLVFKSGSDFFFVNLN
jgi:hypothetical protein